MSEVYVKMCDVRHKKHVHCVSGIERFCARTGICMERLKRGEVTAEELEATGQLMGKVAAKNARERVKEGS